MSAPTTPIIPELPIDNSPLSTSTSTKRSSISNTNTTSGNDYTSYGSNIPSSNAPPKTSDYVLSSTTRTTRTSAPLSTTASATAPLGSVANMTSANGSAYGNTMPYTRSGYGYNSQQQQQYGSYSTGVSSYPLSYWLSPSTYWNMMPTFVTETAYSLYATARQSLSTTTYYALSIWNQNPILRTFTYTFLVMCGIPLTIFSIFALVTLGIAFTVGAVGVGLVEAGILGFGLLCLSPFLFFSFWGAVLAVGAFAAVLYGLRATSEGISTAQRATGLREGTGIIGSTLGIAKHGAALTADVLEKVESKVVGPEGLPAPLSGRV
ncbi:hypothetical protein RI367_007736 [Sorochytrium milnesiophthora]